jgi:hypothetical protein
MAKPFLASPTPPSVAGQPRRVRSLQIKLGHLVQNSHSRCSRQHGHGNAGSDLDLIAVQDANVREGHLIVAENVSYFDVRIDQPPWTSSG